MDLDGDGKITMKDAGLLVDKLQEAWDVIEREAPKYRTQQQCLLGSIALAYSRSFPYTIMFAQSFRVTGWPAVQEGIVMLKEEHRKGKRELEMSQMWKKWTMGGASVSSVSAVAARLDPDKVTEAMSKMFLGVATCVAAAVSPSAQCMSSGISFGDRVAEFTLALYQKYISRRAQSADGSRALAPAEDHGKRWEALCFNTFFKAVGVLAAFYMQRVVNAFQGCMLGASLLAKVVAQKLRERGIECPPHRVNQIQLGICAAGFVWQFKSPSSGKVPYFLTPILFAPLTLERFLEAFASKSMWTEMASTVY
mmetsp:Transcript_3929/g.9902  ORF Transcript_3929/g.9902 Transcript_3929/m.9902 type:complete len:309 (-) Transcript_3929:295-1221(-)